jgi:molybdate transport system substrate-binding protein
LLLFTSVFGAAAQEIRVAAAADLNYALVDVAQTFESRTGKKVSLTFGSSGSFYNAIQDGAPYDVFFSADMDYPKKLEAAGLVVPGSLYEYAVGRIVLWVLNTSKLDLSRGLAVLTDPSVNKIAIANPQHAPYGRAAVAALQSAQLYGRVSAKFVMGEDLIQTLQFIESRDADIGIIALSLALSPSIINSGRYALIPSGVYPSLRQAAVVLKSSKDKATAQLFLDFVKTQPASFMLAQYGFELPVTAAK